MKQTNEMKQAAFEKLMQENGFERTGATATHHIAEMTEGHRDGLGSASLNTRTGWAFPSSAPWVPATSWTPPPSGLQTSGRPPSAPWPGWSVGN